MVPSLGLFQQDSLRTYSSLIGTTFCSILYNNTNHEPKTHRPWKVMYVKQLTPTQESYRNKG